MKECFFGSHSVPPTHENVLGVLSLIIYSLLLVISVKYIAIVMRADRAVTLAGADRQQPFDPRADGDLRRGAPLWRRHDHAGDHGPRRH
jgi:K+ potassium transporter integral membrane domain